MLPREYTRVEWIQGNGDVYVDTGFIANQDTRVVMDFQSLKTTGGWPIIGSRASSVSRSFTFGSTGANNAWLSGYNTGSINSGITEDSERHVVDKNKNLCYLDGNLIATSVYSVFTTPGELRILKFYSADGDSAAFASLKIWSVQIYDNGTIVRNYIPCIDANGDANLWDDVNETLAEKVGTFLYGAPVVPESLSGLVQINTQAGAAFSWNPSENANEYVIARDGVKIATVYGNVTSYTDADAPGKSTYTVTPYNGTQAGTGASITILTKLDTPVNLKASLDDRTVTLTWNAVSGAEGYRVYRDGAVVASVTSTTYTDTLIPPASVAYAVSAYSGAIQSEISQTVVAENWEGVLLTLITDRTAADVEEVRRIRNKIHAAGEEKADEYGFEYIEYPPLNEILTPEEYSAYFAGMRGAYNASDMDRVGNAVQYIADRLAAERYGVRVNPRIGWTMNDLVRQADWNAYLDDVRHLRGILTLLPTTPEITDAMYDGIGYIEANHIEQILMDLDFMITRIILNYVYAGEVFSGEV